MQRKAASSPIRRASWPGLFALATLLAGAITLAPFALADERNFLILLANSPKSVGGPQDPNAPQGSILTTENIRTAYFDTDLPNFTSFKEFWEEISYCHVTISGDVFAWTDLPWPIELPTTIAPGGLVPFTNLDASPVFRYGVGEQFSESRQMFPVDWDGNFQEPDPPPPGEAPDPDAPPAGDPDDGPGDNARSFKPGLVDGVWTPGERFRDTDGDGAWDVAEVGVNQGACPDRDWYLDPASSQSLYEPALPGPVDPQAPDVLTHCDAEAVPRPEIEVPNDAIRDNGDKVYDPGEAWEDFLVRYDPTISTWVRVTDAYLQHNYPGDVQKLLARTGNFTWDGPDAWTESGNTTKMQLTSVSGSILSTPKPSWLNQMWSERYGGTPPDWNESIPIVAPFDQNQTRAFAPDRVFPANDITGEDPSVGSDNIEPDITGYYDGPVEFDDLASSIYHNPPDVQIRDRYSNGDMRLGEVTSPSFDNNSIFGEDLTVNGPETPLDQLRPPLNTDNIIHSAGPNAIRIDGNKLMDAGNQLNIELLTWRTDGTGLTTLKQDRIPTRSIWRDGNFADCPRAKELTPSKDCDDAYFGSTETLADIDENAAYSIQETCCDISGPNTTGCPAQEKAEYGISGIAIDPATGDIYLANRFNGDISVLSPIIDPFADLTDCDDPQGGPPAASPGWATATVVLPLGLLGLNNIEAITFDAAGTLYAIDGNLGKLAVIADPVNDPQSVDVFDIPPVSGGGTPRRLTGLAFDPAQPGELIASDADRFQIDFIDISDLTGTTVEILDQRSFSQSDEFGNFLKFEGISIDSLGQLLGIDENGGFFELSGSSQLPAQARGPGFNAALFKLLDFVINPTNSDHILAVNILPNDGRLLDLDPLAGTGSVLADLSGGGMCAAFLDDNNDGNWTRFNEPFCDENGNGSFDFGGFRDWNLDGLIDQGETIVEGAMNYLDDTDPNTPPTNGRFTDYPFNRVRLMEDAIEANDMLEDYSDFVLGGELPGKIYGVVLVNPSDNPFGPTAVVPRTFQVSTNDGGPILFPDLIYPVGIDGLNFSTALVAHEYGHAWEGWPDLYDVTLLTEPNDPDNARPIGHWDLMSFGPPLVHPGPLLKRRSGLDDGDGIGIFHKDVPWIDVIDLEGVLTPFAPQVTTDPQVVTIETSELTGNNSYYVYTNPDRPAERYFFWRVSNNDTIRISDCSLPGINPDRPSTHRDRLPGQGLMIMHADTLTDPEGIPQQLPSPFNYKIIQADLLTHLEDGVNTGDAGDPFPGSSNVTTWIRKREDNRWNNNGLTGLEILDIVELDNQSIITFRWTPQDVPFFEFLRPPSGESIGGVYQIAYESADRFGGTKLEFFLDGPYSLDPEVQQNLPPRDHLVGNDGVPITPLCAVLQQVGALQIPVAPTDCAGDPTQVPKLPGLFRSTFPVRVDTLEDGDYFFFVRTIPGPGSDGTEQEASIARPRVGNKGTGWITGLDDADPFDGGTPNLITPPTVDIDRSKLETWTVTFEEATDEWTVEGSVSGVQEKAFTAVDYGTDNADVGFVIIQSDECRNQTVNCFEEGDRFIFTTAGKSPHSARIRVDNGLVVIKPVADFTFRFDTGTGSPAKVLFDASASFNPDSNAEPGGFGDLEFIWDFGDGSPPEVTTSPNIQHVFVITEPADIEAGEKEFQVSLVVRNLLTAPPESSVNPAQKPVLVTINGPPEACIDPAGPFAGDTSDTPDGFVLTVDASLDDQCSGDPDNDSILADWDFGDAFADQQNNPSLITDKPIDEIVSHTYKVAGIYTLTLTIREEGGNASDIVATTVTVTGNQAPQAVIAADPIGGPVPLPVTFDGAASFDPDDLRGSDIVSYDWDFGDGNTLDDGGPTPPPYTYLANAPNPAQGYTATLTVTDTLGVAVSDTVQIFAGNQNPVAAFTTDPTPPNIFENQSVEFDGRASFDPENAPLNFSWDFGDGNSASGSVVNHTYPNAGTFTAKLTVDDRRGGSDSTTVVVRVDANDGPVAVIAANPAGGAPPLRVDFTAIGTTDDRTPPDELFYRWFFGDGSTRQEGVGLVNVNHTYNVEGNYTARVEVSDDVLTTTASITIVVRIPDPSPPVASLAADVTSGPAALPVIFDASGSADPDDDLATFLWEFGDGSIAKESLATVTHLAHTYDQPGTFTARLTVFDMRGQSSTAFLEIVVGDGVGDPAALTGTTPFCGFTSGLTLSLGLVSLVGMKRRVRRPRRTRP